MAQNLVTKYAPIIDERFKSGSLTEAAVNHDFNFVGAKTVKLISVSTAPMNDYKRTGANRYGSPEELDNAEQEMTMRRDRSFTFTVDKMNDEESGGSLNAGAALRRQQDEVILPEVDAYRLCQMAAHAGHVEIGQYTGDGVQKPYERILRANKHLSDRKVPRAGRICYVSSDFLVELQLDPKYTDAAKIHPDQLINGQDGKVDKTPVISLPMGYLPEGVDMMTVHPSATTAADKLAEFKIHRDPPGINGDLCEGRVYYDAFVRDMKKDALYVLRTGLISLAVTCEAGSSSTKTVVAVTGAMDDMGTLVYKNGASQTAPALGDNLAGWTVLNLTDGKAEVTVASGHKIVVALRDAKGRAVGASEAVAVVVGS